MRGAAAIAAQSDSHQNSDFSWRWAGPPDDRSGGRVIPTTRSAKPKHNTITDTNTASSPHGPTVSSPERAETTGAQG
jgi:hypothetical protein